jgi:hypothetical protein
MDYIESLKALPEAKTDKKGESSFEGDRHYNLAIAYEARFYETMWMDYKRAEEFYNLADTAIRKARQYDAREKEYVNAQGRIGQGKGYFDTIRKRFPLDVGEPIVDPVNPDPTDPEVMTNKDVVKLVNVGASEKLIIDQINEAKVKRFDVSANGIAQLITAGVSEKIIEAMKRAMRQQPPPRRGKP